jgi:hypothetical protein
MEGEEEEYLVHQCCDCGIDSPRVRAGDTLLSVMHGWRLLRRPAGNGEHVFEWRCSSCWQHYKGSGRASSPQLNGPSVLPPSEPAGPPSSRNTPPPPTPPARNTPPPPPTPPARNLPPPSRPSLLDAVREALKLKP